jgi:hypothetical protein
MRAQELHGDPFDHGGGARLRPAHRPYTGLGEDGSARCEEPARGHREAPDIRREGTQIKDKN